MTSYFISGTGVKMYFNGKVYQNPDSAAVEEGQRLAKSFKNVKVLKITGTKTEIIFRTKTERERRANRLSNCFRLLPRQCQAYA